VAGFAGKTHPGRRPGENEDAIGWDAGRGLWLVADGMGGHASGQTASQVVKAAVLADDGPADIAERLVRAHEAVLEAASADEALTGMGATAVVARVAGHRLEVTWVGDSRAYLWRKGRLTQLSRDHSYVEVLREQNLLSEEQIRGHPHANLVTQTLGHGDPQPSVVQTPLRSGDRILLCSDGLNDELEDGEMEDILRASASLEDAAERLVAAALDKGGRDNVSVVLVEHEGTRLSTAVQLLSRAPWLPIAVGACLAGLVAALLWGDR
jgi:PPM family protein phosphatase